MNTPHRKNRDTLLVIFALSIIPFLGAWYFANNPGKLRLGTNNGDLITPPLTTEIANFSGLDVFSADNLKELQGHWVLINLAGGTPCQKICQDALFKTRQISLMMGKDIARIRRAAMLAAPSGQVLLTEEWREDARLLKISASPPLQEKLARITGSANVDGILLIMDPLGNLMMKYAAGYDPYQVRNDLSKLLRISQIG